MLLVFQEWIVRADLQANRQNLYLFGDNEQRIGLGGQAKEMRGEPNAIGVRTKGGPVMEPWAMWRDEEFDICVRMVDEDLSAAFRHARAGGTIVCPKAGLGTDRAELPKRAPRVMNHIRGRILELKRTESEFRLLITGGRDFLDREFVFASLDKVHAKRPVTMLVQGGAGGADSLAKAWAISRSVPVETHPAKWSDVDVEGAVIKRNKAGKLYNANAGFERNGYMVSLGAGGCVRFPGGNGTADCAGKAEAAGIKVYPPPYP